MSTEATPSPGAGAPTRGLWTSLWSPLVVAILGAAVAAVGNAVVVYMNARSRRTLEAQKAEEARILQVIKTGNPTRAAVNLQFLLDTSLIRDSRLRGHLSAYPRKHPKGGAALPPASGAANLVSKFEGHVGGITPAQAKQLLAQDLAPVRKQVEALVKVDLTAGSGRCIDLLRLQRRDP